MTDTQKTIIRRSVKDAIPCVKWLQPELGSVSTPAGTFLGFIDRDWDRLWYSTPLQEASVKAGTQTDARRYLATLLTRPAQVTVEGEGRSLRVVEEERDFIQLNYDDKTGTHKVTFWDKDHGIESNERLRIEVRSRETGGSVHIFEGRVTEVAEHEVYLSGHAFFDIE